MKTLFKPLYIALLAAFIGGCGDEESDTNVIVNPDDPEFEEDVEGELDSDPSIVINNDVDNDVNVSTSTRVTDEDVHFRWRCQRAPQVVHQQFIHISVRCPTVQEDDKNFDGYLDPMEIEQAVGPRVVALDGDLEAETQSGFPSGTDYDYSQSVPMSRFQEYVPEGQDFIVMFHGAEPSVTVPDTYAHQSGGPSHLTVPIACVVFRAPVIVVEEEEEDHDCDDFDCEYDDCGDPEYDTGCEL